jgi:hypothetical protein
MDRRGFGLLLAVALAASAAVAQEAPAPEVSAPEVSAPEVSAPEVSASTQACLDAFTAGQELRRKGKLRRSRTTLAACAKPECPAVVTEKCVRWIGELGDAIPSVVVVARDAQKRDLTKVRVVVDGELLTERLDGRALEVDPGSRRFRFQRAGAPAVEKKLVIVEREKGRRVEVVLAPRAVPKPPEPEPPERPISPVVWVGLGIGAANLIVGAVSGGLAAERFAELEEACSISWQGQSNYCSESQRGLYDDGRLLADLSTATFVVGGAATVIGLVALVVSLAGPPQESVGWGPSGIEGSF